jgi:TP901 family phage tail tape measure protein
VSGITLNMNIVGNAGSVLTMFRGIGKELDGLDRKNATTWDKMAAVGKRALVGTTVAAVGLGAATVHMAADFQTGMTQIQTGAGESAANMKMVGNGVLNMAGQVGESTKTLTDGLYHIESAGFHGAAGLNVLKIAAEGAKVGNADLDTMGKTLVGTMNSYGMAGDKATVMMNQLVATTAAGDMRMQDLGSSLGNVTPLAAAAGIKFSEVGGAIATMTSQNMSAQQATQDLNNLIRSLQKPTEVATKAMAAMGLSSVDVAKDLGTKGLTGTLAELTGAITKHMGPAGLVLQGSFNQSKTAMADANTMLKALPPSIQGVAQKLLDGTITQKQWTASIKGMNVEQYNQAKQFASTVKHASGFNDILRAGGPAAQTYTAMLAEMTGGATGLNTSLMLTGSNASVFADNVGKIDAAGKKTGDTVAGWDVVQKTFNQQLAEAKGHAEALGIKIGTALLPMAEAILKTTMSLVTWFERHKAVAIALAAVIGGVLSIAVAAYFLKLAKGLVESAKSVAAFASGAVGAFKTVGGAIGSGIGRIGDLAGAARAGFDTVALRGMYAKDKIVELASSGAGRLATMGSTIAGWASTAASAMASAGRAVIAYGAKLAAMAAEAAASFIAMAGEAIAWGASMLAAGLTAMLPFLPIIAAVAAVAAAAYLMYRYWDQIWGFVKSTALAAWHFLDNDVIHPLVRLGLWLIRDEIHALQVVWSAIWGTIKDAALAVWHFLDNDVFQPIVRFGVWYVKTEIKTLQTAWSAIWGGIRDTALAAWRFLDGNVLAPIVKYGIAPIRDGISELKRIWDDAWGAVKRVVADAWNFVKPIFDAISGAASTVAGAIGALSGAAGSVGNVIGNITGLHFDQGGVVPGPRGAPRLAVVHGGEYVLSNDMLAGRAGTGLTGAALAGGGGGGAQTVVVVNVGGSVISERDLAYTFQEAMTRLGFRNSTSYTTFQSSRNRSS